MYLKDKLISEVKLVYTLIYLYCKLYGFRAVLFESTV